MTSPVYLAESSVRLWGGKISDYIQIHNWFDDSKEHVPDIRHRMLKHHSLGIFQCEREFGEYITILDNGTPRNIPTRYIAETHLVEDLGRVPTFADWINLMPIQGWMNRPTRVSSRLDITRGND